MPQLTPAMEDLMPISDSAIVFVHELPATVVPGSNGFATLGGATVALHTTREDLLIRM